MSKSILYLVQFDIGRHIVIFSILLILFSSLATQTVFAPLGGFWTVGASMSDPRTGSGVEGAAVSAIGSKVYVSHGFRFGDSLLLSAYDRGSDTWTHGGLGLPDATVFRSEGAGAAVGGKHYSIGGRTGPTAANEEFDPVAGAWTTKSPMPTARAVENSVAVDSGKIYVIGGRTGGAPGGGGVLGTNERYDVGADNWVVLTPLPTPVSDASAASFGGKIFVFGGIDATGTMQDLVQIYDIAFDSWSLGAVMPTPRGSLSAGMCGSQMHLMGGVDSSFTMLATHEVYDPVSNSWSSDTALPIPISETQGATIGGKIYLIGSGIFGASGTSNQIWNCAQLAVGGTLIPLDTTALLLAGAQSISMWMIPVVVAGVGIGVFVIIRKK